MSQFTPDNLIDTYFEGAEVSNSYANSDVEARVDAADFAFASGITAGSHPEPWWVAGSWEFEFAGQHSHNQVSNVNVFLSVAPSGKPKQRLLSRSFGFSGNDGGNPGSWSIKGFIRSDGQGTVGYSLTILVTTGSSTLTFHKTGLLDGSGFATGAIPFYPSFQYNVADAGNSVTHLFSRVRKVAD